MKRIVTVELEFDPTIDKSFEAFEAMPVDDVLDIGTVVYDCIEATGGGEPDPEDVDSDSTGFAA